MYICFCIIALDCNYYCMADVLIQTNIQQITCRLLCTGQSTSVCPGAQGYCGERCLYHAFKAFTIMESSAGECWLISMHRPIQSMMLQRQPALLSNPHFLPSGTGMVKPLTHQSQNYSNSLTSFWPLCGVRLSKPQLKDSQRHLETCELTEVGLPRQDKSTVSIIV